MHNNDIYKFQYNQATYGSPKQIQSRMTTPSFKANLPENTDEQISDETLKIASKASTAIGSAGIALYHMNGNKKILHHDALAQEIQKQLDEGIYYKQICENLGIAESTYCAIVTKYDIKTARRSKRENSKAVNEEEFKQMVANKVPVTEIQKHFNITHRQYIELLKKYEIKSAKMLADERVENITKEEVEEAIRTSSSISEACRTLQVSTKSYMRLKKKFDIDYDPVNPRADFHNLTDEEIKELAEAKETVAEKSQKYGVTPNMYHNELRSRNISTKNKEAMIRYNSLDIEKLQADIDAKIPKSKLLEDYGISDYQFQRLIDEGLIITPQKAKRDRVAGLTDEEIQEALNNSKNNKEAARILQISESELKKLIRNREGIVHPRSKNLLKQEYSQEFTESFTQDVLSDMTVNEVCEKYQISQDKYYKLIAQFKIETPAIVLRRKLAKITTEQILQAINDADTHKEIYNNIGITKNTYSRLLKRHRIITEHQRNLKQVSEISKEQLLEGILTGKPIYKICNDLGISLATCYSLIKKYNINYSPISKRTNSKEYEKYDVNTLKDCVFNLLMENDTIYNDEELSSLLEFAFERDYKTEEERQELISLLRIINNVALGNITPEQALNRAELKQQLTEMEYTDSLSETLQKISELLRNQNDNISANICMEYIPKSYSDTAKAKEIIELIKSNINPYENNQQNALTKIRKILIYQISKNNEELNTPINEAIQIYGEDNQEKIGQYIIFNQLLNGDLTYTDLDNDSWQFADTLKNMNLKKKEIIKRLIEIEDYFNSKEAENNSLTNFIKHFNSKNNYINKLITDFYIDNIYVNKITTYTNIKDTDKRYFGGKGITVKIYPEAKQKARNYKKGNWDKREFLIDSDKYAQVFASTKFNTSGLKLFTLTENYSKDVFYKDDLITEIKVSKDYDGARLVAKRKNPEDRLIEIKYFVPEGFH